MLDDALGPVAPAAPDDGPSPQEAPHPAVVRFRSCRWHQQRDGTAEYCSHPDVLPYAGRNGFTAEAWCPECDFHKVRRNARRRDADLDY